MPSSNKPPFRDRIIPWYFVMGFAVVFVVNGYFVYVATSSNPGVVTEHSYKKGLAYNETIAKAKEQAALGWQGEVTYNNGQLTYLLIAKDGQAISDAQVKAFISRPLSAENRQVLSLTPVGEGMYNTSVAFPMKGQWQITVQSTWKQQAYQISKRLVIH